MPSRWTLEGGVHSYIPICADGTAMHLSPLESFQQDSIATEIVVKAVRA